jgi:hypothetical protein
MISSANKSDNEISGYVRDANETFLTALGFYITVISGSAAIKQRGTTLSIAMPSVGNVTLSGRSLKMVHISFGKSTSSAKKALTPSKGKPAQSSSSANGSKRVNSKS